MMQKSKTYQARFNAKDAQLVEKRIAESGMRQSDFIRSSLLNYPITPMQNKREIAASLCSILSVLNSIEQSKEVSFIKEEIQKICQYLK